MSLTESIQEADAAQSTFTRRYAAYAKSLGLLPQVLAVHGNLADFIVWVWDKWVEWEMETGRRGMGGLSDAEHGEFDAWLEEGRDGS